MEAFIWQLVYLHPHTELRQDRKFLKLPQLGFLTADVVRVTVNVSRTITHALVVLFVVQSKRWRRGDRVFSLFLFHVRS